MSAVTAWSMTLLTVWCVNCRSNKNPSPGMVRRGILNYYFSLSLPPWLVSTFYQELPSPTFSFPLTIMSILIHSPGLYELSLSVVGLCFPTCRKSLIWFKFHFHKKKWKRSRANDVGNCYEERTLGASSLWNSSSHLDVNVKSKQQTGNFHKSENRRRKSDDMISLIMYSEGTHVVNEEEENT